MENEALYGLVEFTEPKKKQAQKTIEVETPYRKPLKRSRTIKKFITKRDNNPPSATYHLRCNQINDTFCYNPYSVDEQQVSGFKIDFEIMSGFHKGFGFQNKITYCHVNHKYNRRGLALLKNWLLELGYYNVPELINIDTYPLEGSYDFNRDILASVNRFDKEGEEPKYYIQKIIKVF